MINLTSKQISPEVLSLIPRDVAIRFHAIPVSVDSTSVHIALPQNYDEEVAADLSFYLGKQVSVETRDWEAITEALQHYYKVTEIELAKSTTHRMGEHGKTSERDASLPLGRETDSLELTSDGTVVAVVDRIIEEAIRLGASDIHIEPYEKYLRVRYRLDGVLHGVDQLPVSKARPLISRIKIISQLDIAEKRRPQDGRMRVQQDGRTVDIRVSSLPTDFGEKVVLRILDKSQLRLDLARLGFESADLKTFERTIRLPYGMILITGPTGSGKTTTLYAALDHINDARVNITTIEDPIEYNLDGINQTQVRSDIGLTFAAALRSILRQDPNIIMVGEIRDSETAEIAVRAALTGHLVLSTLHTNDAPSAITRLIDMGIEPFLVASSVKMIIAQRLLRKLCDKCKLPHKLTSVEGEELDISGVEGSDSFYEAAGCPSCNNSGYRGRSAVYEVFQIQNELSEHIARKLSTTEIRNKALALGMITLRQAALRKAANGETSISEVLRETAI